MHTTMELAAASTAIDACVALASDVQGSLLVDARTEAKLPFNALVTGTSDRLERFEAVADVGLYLVCRRRIKPGTPAVVGVFPLVHHPDLTHEACDAHWRDNHAPLALAHHAHMAAYDQLSVVKVLSGLPLDGIALCGFASEVDLRERFFTTEASVAVIRDDVARFANTKASPRRLVATRLR